MTSQWMLWQVYPEWLTFENYHLVAYMKATHLAFLNPETPYIIHRRRPRVLVRETWR